MKRVAIFGDAQTVPYVRDTLALEPTLDPNVIAAGNPLSSTLGLISSRHAYGVMASAMPRFFARAKLLGCRTINHWIGTDVAQTMEDARLHGQLRTGANIDVHLCVAPWLQGELAELGVSAHLVPIVPPELKPDPLPVPAKHAVLAYTNEGREEFYGIPLYLELARTHPGVTFYLCGTSRVPESAPANLEVVGRLDWGGMRELYGKTSLLYRMPAHDGLAKMVLEALSHGREVIWSHRLEGVRGASNESEARAALGELLAKAPACNEAGIAVIERDYVPAKIARRTAEILEGLE